MRRIKWSVYTLRDQDGVPRYVGLTSNPVEVRASQHKQAKTPAGEWIRSEIAAGRKVTIRVEKEFRGDGRFIPMKASLMEKKLINTLPNLLNRKMGRKHFVNVVNKNN